MGSLKKIQAVSAKRRQKVHSRKQILFILTPSAILIGGCLLPFQSQAAQAGCERGLYALLHMHEPQSLWEKRL